MLFTFILVVQAIVAALLVGVILMQRSEGGGLGMGGGSPSGFMSARGAADFLTRSTMVLATIFVGLSILLAVIAATRHAGSTVDTSLVGQTTAPAQQSAPAQQPNDGGLGAAAGAAGAGSNGAGNGAVPIAQ